MSEQMEVATVHGVKITYDPEKKQFLARVGGREIKKSSQGAIEKIISKFACGDQRTKAIILEYGWKDVHVVPIEAVGMRGSRVQYKSGMYMEGEDADKVYLHDDELLSQARELQKEHDAWRRRWEALLKKAKKLDPATLK